MLALTRAAARRLGASAGASAARGLQTVTLPDLPYDYGCVKCAGRAFACADGGGGGGRSVWLGAGA